MRCASMPELDEVCAHRNRIFDFHGNAGSSCCATEREMWQLWMSCIRNFCSNASESCCFALATQGPRQPPHVLQQKGCGSNTDRQPNAGSQAAPRNHRITQLEVQLGKAQHTIKHLQANAPGQAGLASGQRTAETTATRGRTIQEQTDLTQEGVHPEPILLQSHRARRCGDTRIHPGVPGHRHIFAIRKITAGSEAQPIPFNPKRKLTFCSPGNTQPISGAAASIYEPQ